MSVRDGCPVNNPYRRLRVVPHYNRVRFEKRQMNELRPLLGAREGDRVIIYSDISDTRLNFKSSLLLGSAVLVIPIARVAV